MFILNVLYSLLASHGIYASILEIFFVIIFSGLLFFAHLHDFNYQQVLQYS